MATINTNYQKLASGYLFPEIARRTSIWQKAHPGVPVLRLGIGNTTEALPEAVCSAMKEKIDSLSDRSTYTGYGDEQGDTYLREALVAYYKRYGVELESTEFFVSDGAKSDAANIQDLFGENNIVAIQDPAYPVYVDSNVVGAVQDASTRRGDATTALSTLPAPRRMDSSQSHRSRKSI
jgi:LL-diaminopimelate aminotransferase